jgi:hypothetical protein
LIVIALVTSHKAQGWTADHVIIAAGRFTAKGAYVACSRGRKSCIVHTPEKARLMERLPEGNRRAALDALSVLQSPNASVLNRVKGWKQLAIDKARQATNRLHRHLAGGIPTTQFGEGQKQAL